VRLLSVLCSVLSFRILINGLIYFTNFVKYIIALINIGLHPVATGALLGLGLSLPTALIVRAYVPIVVIGVVGGAIIGFITILVLA
jgi:hypothetical protein